MKAAVLTKYGKKQTQLELKELPVPELTEHELLIKVHTAGVNPLDLMIMRGEVKLIVPYRLPLVMGNEFCGIVEETGTQVSRFKKGDRVYGRMPLKKIGSFAQYLAIDERAVALVPEQLSDIEAASVPLTALTAMQAFAIMQVQAGKTIFISGGTGSLGAMAIPIAHRLGLHVITNGNSSQKKRVMRLGADLFIDYKKDDYSQVLKDVDYVLDTLGDREIPKEFSILKEGGHLVSLRGLPNGRFAKMNQLSYFTKVIFSLVGRKYDRLAAKNHQTYDFIFVHEDGQQLEEFGKMFDQAHPLTTSVD